MIKQDDTSKHLWLPEVVKYLRLDQLWLACPEKAVYRLIQKGALRSKKINGRFVFDRKNQINDAVVVWL